MHADQVIADADRMMIDSFPQTFEFVEQLRHTAGMQKYAYLLEEKLKKESNKCEQWLEKFVTKHPAMLKVKEHVRILSKINDPVLIQGETGTGKELLARALHNNRKGQFIAVNCAGLPDNLVESELFGYEKGSFTGADRDGRDGLLIKAVNGTIFLDEIGDLSLASQAKVLRAIQEMSIRRVGGVDEQEISCRFVCATHWNLTERVKKGFFREDLYWRISTFTLNTLPLINRPEDISEIVAELDDGKLGSDEALLEWCNKYIRPAELTGNVRSLQQIMRRFLVFNETPKV